MVQDVGNELDEIPVEKTEEAESDEQDLIRYEVASYPSDMTLQVYRDKWQSGQLVIPAFQRKFVWNQVQASKLIESFLLGLPVPGVFLYKERGTNKLLVIDGHQRILSVVSFFEGTFGESRFRLKNVFAPWNGKTFAELSQPDRLQIEDSVLRATVVQQLDPADNSSIYQIFERLNTGGLNLSPMEIRKCVYTGKFYDLLEELNTNADWRTILGQETPDKRTRDVEFVLRVLAMHANWPGYEKPMKKFLNDLMIEANTAPDDALDSRLRETKELFERACRNVVAALGAKPFHLRGRLNLGLLDSIMAMFTYLGKEDLPRAKQAYDQLLADEAFIDAVTYNTSDAVVVRTRFAIAKAKLVDNE